MKQPKTLRGAALAVAEYLNDNYADVRDAEYQRGSFKNRVFAFGLDYYTATAGKPPAPASAYQGWEDREWKDVTPDWYKERFTNRVFMLTKSSQPA